MAFKFGYPPARGGATVGRGAVAVVGANDHDIFPGHIGGTLVFGLTTANFGMMMCFFNLVL